MSIRAKRFSSTLKHSIADIVLNEVNDPRLKSVIIKDVQIDDDLRKAQIYVVLCFHPYRYRYPSLK